MRYLPALFAMVPLVLAACSSGGPKVTLPPVEPQDVEIFFPGDFPEQDYRTLKLIEIQDMISADDREMVMKARQTAADLGADALIIRSLRTTTAGGGLADANASRDRKVLEALAVYYPSAHPELVEQQEQG